MKLPCGTKIKSGLTFIGDSDDGKRSTAFVGISPKEQKMTKGGLRMLPGGGA
jgi:hypothetical protein